jgi:hypothetical protein
MKLLPLKITVMVPTADIASALTEVWLRNGAPKKTPKEVADFYCALYSALEESQRNKILKFRSKEAVIQLTMWRRSCAAHDNLEFACDLCEMRLHRLMAIRIEALAYVNNEVIKANG